MPKSVFFSSLARTTVKMMMQIGWFFIILLCNWISRSKMIGQSMKNQLIFSQSSQSRSCCNVNQIFHDFLIENVRFAKLGCATDRPTDGGRFSQTPCQIADWDLSFLCLSAASLAEKGSNSIPYPVFKEGQKYISLKIEGHYLVLLEWLVLYI